jgi:hypothetical protein
MRTHDMQRFAVVVAYKETGERALFFVGSAWRPARTTLVSVLNPSELLTTPPRRAAALHT